MKEKIDQELFEFINAALRLDYFNENDKKSFESFIIWLLVKNVYLVIDKDNNLNLAKKEKKGEKYDVAIVN